ncbi:MAG: hypothetical protein HAW62_00090 [Endozoicomonadaceae bacterium]|nr:hypothetical protein [Endozoicomonadaceae bacterium]
MVDQHVTAEERSQIEILLSQQDTINAIRIRLQRSPVAISRDMFRPTKGKR